MKTRIQTHERNRMNVRTKRLGVLLALTSLIAAGCGGRDDPEVSAGSTGGKVAASPGITDTEIKLGGSYPLSGPVSAYAAIGDAAKGYFKYVNEELGGVKMADGKTRKIDFIIEDDAYLPDRAVANAKKLIEDEKVFMLFNTLGTPNNTAIMPYANAQKVPQTFVASGAGIWGKDLKANPWTSGWQIAYPTEAAIYAQYLKDTKPNAKVAVLFQNDDYGKDYLGAFKQAIEGSQIKVVAEQGYQSSDPTVDQQVISLSQSGADTFFNVATPKFAAQAIKKIGELGWKPLHLLNSVSNSTTSVMQVAGVENSQGIVSIAYLKDPGDPQWADDQGMKDYRTRIVKYAPKVDPLNSFGVFGFAVGESLVKVLEKTEEPTRESFMKALRSMRGVPNSLLLPGMTMNTSATDGYPVEAAQLQKFTGDRWVLDGKLLDFEGKTKPQ